MSIQQVVEKIIDQCQLLDSQGALK
jgi:hypothetical protein